MPATTRSLRSSARLNAAPAQDDKKPSQKSNKSDTKAASNGNGKPVKTGTDATGGRKRKAVNDEEKDAKTKVEEDEPSQRPAKKAKKPAAGKKETPPKKTKDELKALRDGPVPDVNPDAERRDPPATHYWLMKSEPDVRIEDGYEIKFSIDDLAAKKKPEGWEGKGPQAALRMPTRIRNYVARNNLRGMRKGDKAFFYHSNCKEPGVVGIMSIVKEHSPDCTAPHDGSKWSLVHVKIEHKFPRIVPLSLLKESRGKGPLQNMELLRLARLSVTKVTPEEWDEVIRMAKELDTDDEWDKTVEDSKKFPNYSAA
ncbi:Thymocyte nuclear protein 1 [Colletotrichum chlorophyti]|uniref:Thymocyte nuclear protein 1 n=1 Tax=Colletotrichum chlorophyti TaxID=708187 RepID=A0A1Q8RXC4_9PEZI|nr:Thymocyte nuclear protein 1 [Colletotrichum chlorophyti]